MVLQAGCQGCPSVKAHVGYLVSKTKFGVLAVALLPQTQRAGRRQQLPPTVGMLSHLRRNPSSDGAVC